MKRLPLFTVLLLLLIIFFASAPVSATHRDLTINVTVSAATSVEIDKSGHIIVRSNTPYILATPEHSIVGEPGVSTYDIGLQPIYVVPY